MFRWSPGRRSVFVLGALLALVAAAAVGIYAGVYNIAADVPHTQLVYWLFETVRERSVAARARDIVVSMIWLVRTASQKVRANTRNVQRLSPCPRHEADGDQPGPIPPRARASAQNLPYGCRAVLDRQARRQNDGHASLGCHA